MQYSAAFLALFAASGAMAGARPGSGYHRSDKSVTISLRGAAADSEVVFRREPGDRPFAGRPDNNGPFEEVELTLGDDVQNDELRCQVLDQDRNPIVVLRGNNTDNTFADGDKGAWKFRAPTNVHKVVCSQDFEKIDPQDDRLAVTVLLQNDSTGITRRLSGVVDNTVDVAQDEVFDTVTLMVTGELVDPALRCQLTGEDDKPLVILRGANTDETFADGGKGAWTIRTPAKVKKVTCNPAFQQIDPTDDRLQVTVNLNGQGGSNDFRLSGAVKNFVQVTDGLEYDQVTLSVTGDLVDPTLRCQLIPVVFTTQVVGGDQPEEKPVTVTRGENVDVTFADGGKGAWAFESDAIAKIVCDPAFKQGTA